MFLSYITIKYSHCLTSSTPPMKSVQFTCSEMLICHLLAQCQTVSGAFCTVLNAEGTCMEELLILTFLRCCRWDDQIMIVNFYLQAHILITKGVHSKINSLIASSSYKVCSSSAGYNVNWQRKELSKGLQQQQYHLCHFFLLWGLETLVLFYWICCVCSWCMWGAGLPKWINTITSSRWLRHLVPLPVIVLMLYWLLLSREPNLHAVLLHCIPFTHIILHHTTSTIPALSHP